MCCLPVCPLSYIVKESRWVISSTLDAAVSGASGEAYVEMQVSC